MNFIEEFEYSTVCNENNGNDPGFVDPLDEGIRDDDDNAPTANYSVNFITSETGNKSYIY